MIFFKLILFIKFFGYNENSNEIKGKKKLIFSSLIAVNV